MNKKGEIHSLGDTIHYLKHYETLFGVSQSKISGAKQRSPLANRRSTESNTVQR